MNRRQFLQSLAAVSLGIALPESAIANAADEEIDILWRRLEGNPATLYVGETGMLSSRWGIEGVDYFISRGDLMHYDPPPNDAESLTDYIYSTTGLRCHIQGVCSMTERNDENQETWLSEGGLQPIHGAVCDWLDDEPGDEDYTNANLMGNTGRGDAMAFFRRNPELMTLFEIYPVSPGQPAHPNYGAWMRIDAEEANALARSQGVPLEFA